MKRKGKIASEQSWTQVCVQRALTEGHAKGHAKGAFSPEIFLKFAQFGERKKKVLFCPFFASMSTEAPRRPLERAGFMSVSSQMRKRQA